MTVLMLLQCSDGASIPGCCEDLWAWRPASRTWRWVDWVATAVTGFITSHWTAAGESLGFRGTATHTHTHTHTHTQSEIERDVLCAGKTVINSRGGQRMKTNIRSYTLVYDKYTTVCVSLAVIWNVLLLSLLCTSWSQLGDHHLTSGILLKTFKCYVSVPS